MEKITSRKNEYIKALRDYRGEDFLCCGEKMLEEAVKAGAEITSLLWKEAPGSFEVCSRQFYAPAELFDYAAPMKNSPGPVFTARIKPFPEIEEHSAIILENVQDPGNVGTVIRTANAFDIDCVYLLGDCAGLRSFKTVRASMGAVFYQRVKVGCLPSLPVYGAALAADSVDITKVSLKNCAVAIGSEGHGLSKKLLDSCAGKIIIPMSDKAESLNAAVAASICMWEMSR